MDKCDLGVTGNDPFCGDCAVRQGRPFAVSHPIQTGKIEHTERISRTAKADSLCVFLSVRKIVL